MKYRTTNKIIFCLFISAIFIWGCERGSNANEPLDIIPPVPSGVSVYYAYDGEILFIWNNDPSGATKFFTIYRSVGDTLNFTMLASTSKDFYFDDSLYYDTTYYYKIKATSFSNRESDFSAYIYAVPQNQFAPKKVIHFLAEGRNWEGERYFFLSWELLKESDIAGYNIYKSDVENFAADSGSYIGFSANSYFVDKSDTISDKRFFYKIRGLDKGGLIGKDSDISFDEINNIPELIFPADRSTVDYFENFIIKTISKPIDYLIILQSNPYYGEIWSEKFYSTAISDTINIHPKYTILYPYRDYYWRIVTYSKDRTTPNSISPVYSFRIKL